MDRILIQGGTPLFGSIDISGAKNAALPLMAACLLTEETLTLRNVPALVDISSMARLLRRLGVAVGGIAEDAGSGGIGGEVSLDAAGVGDTFAPYDLVRRMRASILVLGPLVARFGAARVSLPGGCAIGTRPVDLHLAGLAGLGAEIAVENGYVRATAPRGLRGGGIALPFASVGATENLMMAASLARGETVLANAAREPEIVDLADCLAAMGAVIEGAGSERITIRGVERLGGADHAVIADRIEAGTWAMAAAITGGRVELRGVEPAILRAALGRLADAGLEIETGRDRVRVGLAGCRVRASDVVTEPYPGFPTDLQAQMMALMTLAEGRSTITETIFENRFMHVPELCRMGADIRIDNGSAIVSGVSRLNGAPVMATDLRASVSLILAGLAARGETEVNRVYHLDRGYERIEDKLAACGAVIERVGG